MKRGHRRSFPCGCGRAEPPAPLVASDGAAYEQLGWSVSLDGDRVLAGALGVGSSYKRAAYVFDLGDSDGDGVPDSLDVCPGTVLPEDMPEYLKRNRYYADANGDFVDAPGVWSGITVIDTGGCSGGRISPFREKQKGTGPFNRR